MLKHNRIIGFTFAVLTGICFASKGLFVKLCSDVPLSLIIVARSLIQIITSIVFNQFIWKQKLNPKGKTAYLCLFGVLCFFVTYGNYMAFQYKPISLGEIIIILSTCPIFVALIERIVMKIPISTSIVLSGTVCTVGAFLLSYSNITVVGGDMFVNGLGAVILVTIAQAVKYIMIRHLEVHFVIPVFYIGIWNGALSLMVLFIHDPSIGMHIQEIPVVQWIWFSLVSAFAVTGGYTVNLALQYENAPMVALVRNIDIALAFAYDVAILKHNFSAMSLIGSCLVAMATIGSGLAKAINSTKTSKDYTYNRIPLDEANKLEVDKLKTIKEGH